MRAHVVERPRTAAQAQYIFVSSTPSGRVRLCGRPRVQIQIPDKGQEEERRPGPVGLCKHLPDHVHHRQGLDRTQARYEVSLR